MVRSNSPIAIAKSELLVIAYPTEKDDESCLDAMYATPVIRQSEIHFILQNYDETSERVLGILLVKMWMNPFVTVGA